MLYFTYPEEKLRHHHIALLTGGVQGRGRQPQREERPGGEGPAQRAVGVLFGAVSQKEQQLREVALHRCQEESSGQRDVGALAGRGRRQRRNKEFLLILGPDPRLPFFAGNAKDKRGGKSQHGWSVIKAKVWGFLFFFYRVASGAGFRRPVVRPSQMLFTMWLPMARRTSVSSQGRSSRSRERTRDRWVPRFLWMPEHSMHMRAPRFRLAQVGSWRKSAQLRFGATGKACTSLRSQNVPDANMQGKSGKLRLTWSAAVDAEVVALGVADGLQSHGFALAAPASLGDDVHRRTLTPLPN